MEIKNNLLSLREIRLLPTEYTNENFRACDIALCSLDGISSFPIFSYPSTQIISEENVESFQNSGIRVIIPLEIDVVKRMNAAMNGYFSQFTLQEVEKIFLTTQQNLPQPIRIYIEGSSIDELNIANRLRTVYKNYVILMGGPVSNPEAYVNFCEYFDYVIVGNGIEDRSGIYHYPLATLLLEIQNDPNLKRKLNAKCTKNNTIPARIIVSDTEADDLGMAMVCLGLGADYVMLSEYLCTILEASGKIWYKKSAGEYVDYSKDPAYDKLKHCTPSDFLTLSKTPLRSFSGRFDKMITVNKSLSDFVKMFADKAYEGFRFTNSINWAAFHNNIKVIGTR